MPFAKTWWAWMYILFVCPAHEIRSINCVDEMENFPLDVNDNVKNDSAQSSIDQINVNERASPLLHDKVDLNGLTSSGSQVKLFNQLMMLVMKRPAAKEKLAQVIPIIRAMSPSQRLTLATLVMRQMKTKSTQVSYHQLMENAVNRTIELMIPISLDIASIFNPAGKETESGRSSVFGTYYYNPLSAGYRVNGPPPQKPLPPLYNIRRYQPSNSRRKDGVPPEMMPPPYSSPSNDSYANFNKKSTTQTGDEDEDSAENFDEEEDDIILEDDTHNDSSEIFNKDCVPYINNLCLDVRSYPTKDILHNIKNLEQTHVFRVLVEDTTRNVTVDTPEMERRHGTVDNENLHLCATKVKYARPRKAKSMHGNWKYVVNTESYTQTVRIETCLNAEKSCPYLIDNVKSHCTQIYDYHRLLTWDEKSGLSLDLFKIPTCCSCQIQQVSPFTNEKKPSQRPDVGIQDNVIADEASIFHSKVSKPQKSKSKPTGPLVPKRESFSRPRRPRPILPLHQEGNERGPVPPPRQLQPKRHSPHDNSIRRTSHKTYVPPKEFYVPGKGELIENAEIESTTQSHRINYNYHPIIDFFNPSQKERNVDRADAIDDWLPMTEGPRTLQS